MNGTCDVADTGKSNLYLDIRMTITARMPDSIRVLVSQTFRASHPPDRWFGNIIPFRNGKLPKH